jgi:hypothetical protein
MVVAKETMALVHLFVVGNVCILHKQGLTREAMHPCDLECVLEYPIVLMLQLVH